METREVTGLDFDSLGAWFIHLDRTEGIKGLKAYLAADAGVELALWPCIT